jgi:hypothetical protein
LLVGIRPWGFNHPMAIEMIIKTNNAKDKPIRAVRDFTAFSDSPFLYKIKYSPEPSA